MILGVSKGDALKAEIGLINPTNFTREEVFKRKHLEYYAFKGFIPIRDLRGDKIKEVPTNPGLYVVLREDDTEPNFLDKNVADFYTKKSYTFDIELLKERWVKGQHLIYISAAKSLRQKIRWYLKYKKGFEHETKIAGRIIWQIEGHNDFVIAWQEEDDRKIDYSTLIRRMDSYAFDFKYYNGKHIYGFVNERQ